MSLMNRLGNATNPYQGRYRRVLCVCSAGLLRSPSAALVLAQAPFNFNTRAAGLSTEYALIPVDDVLLRWADEIVCMTSEQAQKLNEMNTGKRVICLDIPDSYEYRNPGLLNLIKERYTEMSGFEE